MEPLQINFVIKSRALRYIAAANDDWLYPERHVRESDWYRFGYGYLLMPDPRSTSYGGEIIIGNKDGTATAFDEYGRRPWDDGFKHNGGVDRDWETFNCFKGEFARLFGPYRRGRACQMMSLDKDRDSDDYHQHHLSLESPFKKHLGKE